MAGQWWEREWTRVARLRVVERHGGEVLGEIAAPADLEAARALLTAGRKLTDICRCPGDPVIELRDVDGRKLGAAGLHGDGRVSWERGAHRDDVRPRDPAGLRLLLMERGVRGMLSGFVTPLMQRLGVVDDFFQYRPAGAAGLRMLAERGVPEVLWSALGDVSGEEAANLSPDVTGAMGRALAGAVPDPVDRAAALLAWGGRLQIPIESFGGEGVLVGRLLAGHSAAEVAEAVGRAGPDQPYALLGALIRTLRAGAEGPAIEAVAAPILRGLFPAPGRDGRAEQDPGVGDPQGRGAGRQGQAEQRQE